MVSIASVVEKGCKSQSAKSIDACSVSAVSTKAPGKLIISGEHAVVYGAPSIAIAIDMYAQSEVVRNKNHLLGFDFANLKYNAKHTIKTISKLKDKAFIDYQRFLHGECSIREVVNKPFELLQFAVSNFLDKLNIVLPGGIDIKTHSTIPSGCGLGSSAATIMSLLYAVGNLLDLKITNERYIELGRSVENLQHGKSSGVDINLTVEGGCLRYQNGGFNRLDIKTANMYLINTGRPLVTTGECVSKVKKHFTENDKMLHEFIDLTLEIEKMLIAASHSDIIYLIQENHNLLNYIGIVPARVNEYISKVNTSGAAAKVCGSGAVAGDNAGAVLVVCPDQDVVNQVSSISKMYNYTMQAVNVDNHGIRVA